MLTCTNVSTSREKTAENASLASGSVSKSVVCKRDTFQNWARTAVNESQRATLNTTEVPREAGRSPSATFTSSGAASNPTTDTDAAAHEAQHPRGGNTQTELTSELLGNGHRGAASSAPKIQNGATTRDGDWGKDVGKGRRSTHRNESVPMYKLQAGKKQRRNAQMGDASSGQEPRRLTFPMPDAGGQQGHRQQEETCKGEARGMVGRPEGTPK